MNIGIAGTGRMGAAIAQRLAALGHRVTVWNRTPAKAAQLEKDGAIVARTLADLVRASDVVITILTDAKAIDALYSGSEGLLSGDVRGKTFIEMSTVRPETQRALDAKVRAKGAALVECPVGGTVGPAREGKLLGLAGGADEDVKRVRPLLESLCRRVEHLGPIGAGTAGKLAINLPLMIYWQALGEALALVEPIGIEPSRLIELLADTSGGPNVLKTRGKAIAEELAGGYAGPVTFDVDSMRKDLVAMIAEGNALGVDMPLSAKTLACFDDASREGLGAKDCAVIPARWARKARRGSRRA
jgi:3-hydroxyisobutyrate dehydrogenase